MPDYAGLSCIWVVCSTLKTVPKSSQTGYIIFLTFFAMAQSYCFFYFILFTLLRNQTFHLVNCMFKIICALEFKFTYTLVETEVIIKKYVPYAIDHLLKTVKNIFIFFKCI